MRSALLLLLIVSCFGLANAHERQKVRAKSDDKAVLADLYKQSAKMFEKKDINGLMKGATADFTETSMGHTLKRAAAVKDLRQFLNMFQKLNCTFAMKTAKVSGNTAVTTDSVHCWGLGTVDPKSHKSAKLDATRDETMTWQRNGKGWLVKSIVASNEKMTVNGKPMMSPGASKQ